MVSIQYQLGCLFVTYLHERVYVVCHGFNYYFSSLTIHLVCNTLAVLMLDDDTLVSVPDISFAFSVWKVSDEAVETNY